VAGGWGKGARGRKMGRRGEEEKRRKGEKEKGRWGEVFVKIRGQKVINSIFHELKVFYLVASNEGSK
ncbi:MAG: hypothetical protein WCD55_08270, partial [Bacteroidales bacterium]